MRTIACALLLTSAALAAGPWSAPVEVRHEDALCIAYRARFDGPYLVVKAEIGPGWHTFAMDNQRRAAEKLAGKTPISIDRATEITAPKGVEVTGSWYQSEPKDLSRPALRWFSWGYEKEAVFAVKARRTAAAGALKIRGQACTETICKNIDVEVPVPGGTAAGAPEVRTSDLSEVKLGHE
jgi:hypothetical protein